MAEEEIGIRSEKLSIKSLDEALGQLLVSRDTDEVATMLVLVNELYADASCRCEEKEAVYGEEAPEVKVCNIAISGKMDELYWAYRVLIDRLKAGIVES